MHSYHFSANDITEYLANKYLAKNEITVEIHGNPLRPSSSDINIRMQYVMAEYGCHICFTVVI